MKKLRIPPGDQAEMVQYRIPASVHRAVIAYAQKEGVSVNLAIVRMIIFYLRRHEGLARRNQIRRTPIDKSHSDPTG